MMSNSAFGSHTLSEIRRFLTDWAKMMKPAFMGPRRFRRHSCIRSFILRKIIDDCILPVGQELNLPLPS
jgi:hypothetical protein